MTTTQEDKTTGGGMKRMSVCRSLGMNYKRLYEGEVQWGQP